MIKDPEIVQKLEREEIAERKFTYSQALKIFTALWREGMNLGVLPPEDPLEGIGVDIEIARILNTCSKD